MTITSNMSDAQRINWRSNSKNNQRTKVTKESIDIDELVVRTYEEAQIFGEKSNPETVFEWYFQFKD